MGDIIASIDEALHICVQQDAQIEMIREELKAKDAEIERLRAALQNIESETHGLGMSRQIARDALVGEKKND